MTIDLVMVAAESEHLTAAQIADAEKALRRAPDDLVTRAKLIGHYSFKRSLNLRRFTAHALWIIEHEPRCELADSPVLALLPLPASAIAQARGWWFAHLKRAPHDLALIRNAAWFFRRFEPAAAARLLQRGRRLEPRNAEWLADLGRLYSGETYAGTAKHRRASARKALAFYESAQAMTRARTPGYRLSALAEMAFAAGELSKAKRWATRMIARSTKGKPDWNSGNLCFTGHEILGRLALLDSRRDVAKNQLLLAASTRGSPQLISFGPSFQLARSLLELGEWETVAEFLRGVRVFWHLGQNAVDVWLEDIARHRIPDFDQWQTYL